MKYLETQEFDPEHLGVYFPFLTPEHPAFGPSQLIAVFAGFGPTFSTKKMLDLTTDDSDSNSAAGSGRGGYGP